MHTINTTYCYWYWLSSLDASCLSGLPILKLLYSLNLKSRELRSHSVRAEDVVQLRSCVYFWPYKLQHGRLPCPSLFPGLCSNSCPLSKWWYLTISSSTSPFSSSPQCLPSSGSFPMNHLYTSGCQSIWTSALASVLPMNIQSWFLLGLAGLIFVLSKRLLRVFSWTTIWKH